MKRFSNLFLVSLLSGATTLGAYKILFDNDGYFSSDKKSIVTMAPANYGRTVGLSAEAVDFTEAARQNCPFCRSRKKCFLQNNFQSNDGVFLWL